MTAEREGAEVEAVLAAHQRRATLSDACTCGYGDLSTLRETGEAMRAHWTHVAAVIAGLIVEREAKAWDEGKWACYSVERESGDGSVVINPYRAALAPKMREGSV